MKHPVSSINAYTAGNNAARNAVLQKVNQVTMAFGNMHLDPCGIEEKVSKMNDCGIVQCSYCCIAFHDIAELRAHCQTESHQTVIMSDEGRDWKYRPPPRGLTSDAYVLCENWCIGGGTCRYEAQCVDAHGPDELTEWQERFEYRRMKLQRAFEKELFGKSYAEQLLERWVQAANPENVMKEKLQDVEESCNCELMKMVSSKISNQEWKFTLRTHRLFRAVALLQDTHRNHFFLKKISSSDVQGKTLFIWEPSNANDSQEWDATNLPAIAGTNSSDHSNPLSVMEHVVEVSFTTDIYGTFRQSVVFDFGCEPVLVRHLCVDVVPVTDMDRMKEINREYVLSGSERWDQVNTHIVKYVSSYPPVVTLSSYINDEREKDLLNAYPTPQADTFTLTQCTVVEKKLTCNNYRARMHELLYVEEMAQYDQVAQYNLVTKLQLANCYLLAPNGPSNSTAKYANSGELFALMNLEKDVSEDTSAGRLILNNCTTVLLSTLDSRNRETGEKKDANGIQMNYCSDMPVAYEALIEDKGKNIVYLRISSVCVEALQLQPDTELMAEVQFQLNRIPYCEWHYAVDKIADFKLIFPDTFLEPSIPWTPLRQWSEILDPRLNLKQKEAIVAITTPVNCVLPPILIIGPFGTGKTYTLAQAIKQILIQPHTRILVCTHSNSAADLYIKDYLHPYVEEGHEYARPLRIYYYKRWVATVNPIVQKYSLIDIAGGTKSFRVPTLEDIKKHRVIVTTLSISMYLSSLGLEKGFFSHILLDEAAQVMESEAIMPLALADEETRIVLAGDHMQLSPELFSPFAKERNLHVSLLERLYDHYPANFPCKILLCENYRAHEAIIQFTSELFYEQKLISSGKQPQHDSFYPLTFFTTRGEDIQDVNSTAFYNNSEVYEVVERVSELRKKWPVTWGKLDDQSIGIMTPYSAQVFRIRSELRKRRLGGISVERVLNVQGKQFRAIFLSTVRTHRTCHPGSRSSVGVEDMDYGFLSNSKLLNTAITRAQSLVAVIGDPVALCSIGRCRKVWERFIEICNDNKSLFGMTWSSLRSQLDGVELKKTFVLNPLAPEFIPRQYQPETYIQIPPVYAVDSGTSIVPYTPPLGEVPIGLPPGSEPALPSCMPPATHMPRPTHLHPPPTIHLQPSFSNTNPPPVFFYTGSPVPPVHPPPPGPLSGPNSNFYPLKALGSLSIVNPPPLMYSGVVPPLNSWGNPLISSSPSILRANAQWGQTIHGEFLKKTIQTSQQMTNVLPLSYHEELQAQNCFGPSGRANGLPNVNGHTCPPHGALAAQGSVTDCYIPGGVLSPTMLPQGSPSSDTVCTSTNGVADKVEQIQFLQNVHFPEKLSQVKEKRKDITTVLPPEVSLSQLFHSEAQQEWYKHVLETSGLETANKFMEKILSDTGEEFKTPPSMSPTQECFHPHVVQGLEDLFSDKMLGNVSTGEDHVPESCNAQRSHVLPQLRASQHNKSQVKYSDRSVPENLHLQEENYQTSHEKDEGLNYSSCSTMDDLSKQSWPPLPLQNNSSVYPPQEASAVTSPEAIIPPFNDLLDGVVEKGSIAGSGAFAGYARAAVSIGFQHCNESTVPNTPTFQQYHINHQLVNNYPHCVVQQDPVNFHPDVECDSEDNHSNCTVMTNRLTRRSENTYTNVLRTRTDSVQPNGRKEFRNKTEDPYSVLQVLESKNTQRGPRLYNYFS